MWRLSVGKQLTTQEQKNDYWNTKGWPTKRCPFCHQRSRNGKCCTARHLVEKELGNKEMFKAKMRMLKALGKVS